MPLINFSGIASGIDSSALIEALIEQQRELRIVPLEEKISSFQDENSALEELSSLLSSFGTLVDSFRLVSGGPFSKAALSSDETILTASASNAAKSGTYSIDVKNLASSATFSFDDRFSDPSEVINSNINDAGAELDRTVSFTIGTGASAENVDITLSSTSTAQDFVNAFNDQSENATASLVNLGTATAPSYGIVVTSNETGTESGQITLNSVGSEISTGITPAFTTNSLQQAENLEFQIAGIGGTISRSSNTVSDVIEGVTFNASQVGTSTISVALDTDETEARLQEFVDSYNEILQFIQENDTITRSEEEGEVTSIFGPLAKTSLDENVLGAIKSAISAASSSGERVNILADLGITTNRDGTLSLDSEELQTALAEGSSSAEELLIRVGDNLGGTNGTIAQFTRFNGLLDQTLNSNTEQISAFQERISRAEDQIAQREQSLLGQYSRLESVIGRLTSQQQALSSALAGLGAG